MKRVGLILPLVLGLLAAPLRPEAQRPIPLVGYLGESPSSPLLEPFRQALRDLGWIEGKNITIEYRWTKGRTERLPELVAELIRLNVDLIYTPGSNAAARVAKEATAKIPIVFTTPADPLATGLVSNLARPGGNVTGLGGGIQSAKRLELLREVVPEITRVAVLWNSANPSHHAQLEKDVKEAAKALGFTLQLVEVRAPAELDRAFGLIRYEQANALVVMGDPLFFAQRVRIVDLAARHRLPAIYNRTEYVNAGGLISYAADTMEQERRAAVYVDKILKGTKAAHLPVEQPTKFELVVNLKTAKALGLTIPQSVLLRADEVIQ